MKQQNFFRKHGKILNVKKKIQKKTKKYKKYEKKIGNSLKTEKTKKFLTNNKCLTKFWQIWKDLRYKFKIN